jgi:hypothetical protein
MLDHCHLFVPEMGAIYRRKGIGTLGGTQRMKRGHRSRFPSTLRPGCAGSSNLGACVLFREQLQLFYGE